MTRTGKRRIARWAWVLLGAFAAFNLVAYSQAWKMTHFVSDGVKTAIPEKLSFPAKLKVLLTGVTVPHPLNLKDPSSVGLPFSTVQFPGGSTASLEAWSIAAPATQAWVLLFHGYAGNKSQLLQEAQVFHGFGYNVLLVDLPGSGGSSGNVTSIGYFEGKDVAAACTYARSSLHASKLVLYGLSMGAASILRAVSREGAQPDAVILECPFDSLLGTAVNRFHLMGLPGFPGAQAIVFWASVQQGANFFRYRLSQEAPAVHCRALLMAGRHDQRATVPEARAVFDALAGPKEWLLFEQAGHQQYLEADEVQWKKAVSALLKF
jgi:pimeloyl-ACP methyl ester carboxylesterase